LSGLCSFGEGTATGIRPPILERLPKRLLQKRYVVEAVSEQRRTLLGRKLRPLRRSTVSQQLK
jgi:hypothetical protein